MKNIKRLTIALLILIPVVIIAAGGIKEFSQDTLRFGSSSLGDRSLIFDYAPDGNSAILSVNPSNDEFTFNNKVNLDGSIDVTGNYTSTAGNLTLTSGNLVANAGTLTGLSIVTPLRLDVKQDTEANLTTYALTADDGQLVFATDTQKMYQIIDNLLAEVGGGGVGSPSIYKMWDMERDDTADWTISALGSETLTYSEVSPLSGVGSYIFAPDLVNEHVVTDAITLDPRQNVANQTHLLKFLHYLTAGETTITVLDQADNVISDPLIIASGDGVSSAELMFNVTASVTGVKVKFEVTSYTAGMNFYIDDIEFDDNAFETRGVYASSEWEEYSPTISAGFGATSGEKFFWRRVGDTMEVKGIFTTGTTLSVNATVTLPSGYEIDTSKIQPSQNEYVGIYARGGIVTTSQGGYLLSHSSLPGLVSFGNEWDANLDSLSPAFANAIFGASEECSLNFKVPIKGWTDKANHVARQQERQQAHFVGSIEWQPTTGVIWSVSGTAWADYPANTFADDNARVVVGEAKETTSTPGQLPRILFDSLKKGHYEIKVSGGIYDSNTATSHPSLYRIYDGTSSSSIGEVYNGTTGGIVPSASFTIDYASDQTNVEFRLQGRSTNAAGFADVYVVDPGFKISVYYYPPPEEKNVITTVLLPQSERNEFAVTSGTDGSLSGFDGAGDWLSLVSHATGQDTYNLNTNYFSEFPKLIAEEVGFPSGGSKIYLGVFPQFSVYSRDYENTAWANMTKNIKATRAGVDHQGEKVYVGSVPRNQVMQVSAPAQTVASLASYSPVTIPISSIKGDVFGSISSNQLTLPPGKYIFSGAAITYRSSIAALTIYDTTGAATVATGPVGISSAAMNPLLINTEPITFSVASVLEFRGLSLTADPSGHGNSGWVYDIIQVKITKLND